MYRYSNYDHDNDGSTNNCCVFVWAAVLCCSSLQQTDGLIWVVDSADVYRLELCRDELISVLQQERLAGATLLILANKQDVDGALSVERIAQILQLHDSNSAHGKNRHWHILACSAVTGDGLREGMDWIVDDIASRIFMLA
jgi:ADP-ribosylation factor-like protein 2